MRNRMMMLLSFIMLMLVVGVQSVVTAAGPANHYSTMVYDITDMGNPMPIDGSWATLTTNDQGASLQVHTSDLPAGHGVTVWWVIFNYPENCSDGVCGADDAFPPPGNIAAGASVSFAAGHVIGNNGRGNFGAHISAGGDAAPWTVGLLHPRTAEYHFALRDHGPMEPGLVNEQILTAGGGCNNVPPFTGTYTCVDFQGGMFTD
jgi:hypothetical protein